MSLRIKSFEEYKSQYSKSVADPAGFWSEIAAQFVWKKKWDTILKADLKTPD